MFFDELLLEAEGDEGGDGGATRGETPSESEFQLDDDVGGEDTPEETTNDNANNENEEDPNNENNDEGSSEDDYQLNNSGEDEGGDDQNNDMDNTSGDDLQGGTSNPEDESENLKKYILFNEYKELYSITDNLLLALENFFNYYSGENEEDIEDLTEIHDKIQRVKDNITFVIINKYESENYQNLLKYYLYFKETIKILATEVESSIKERQEQ